MMKRLAIVVTHPIQYYAPVFKLLAKEMDIKVFYTWGESSVDKFDPGFGKAIKWDVNLLEGYKYEFISNVSSNPGSDHFGGIVNPELNNLIKDFKPSSILIYGWAYKSHLGVLRHFKNKIPIYFRGDSTLLDKTSRLKSFLKTVFLKWVYSHVDIALYTGTNNKAYFKKYGLREEQLVFAPHCVDNDRFAVEIPADVKLFRQGLTLKPTDKLVLFAGKLEAKKDPLLLLKAFLMLAMPDCYLLFVGNGVLENALKQHTGANRNIRFLDFQNQSFMPVIYQACDVFCLPSAGPGETWGLAVNEAMACRKAICVSDKVGCAVDLVKDNENGLIFKSKDQVDLKNKLSSLLTQPSRLNIFGERSGEIIQDWSYEQFILSIKSVMNLAGIK